jgi:hypothetical protein
MVKVLRETEKVDVVIALSHGGMEKGKDGRFTDGEDVRLPKAVPGIDVVIGAHSHTALQEAVIVNGHTPVVQTGKYGENLGELVITLDGGKLTVESYKLYPIDDTIAGDRAIADEIEKFKKRVTEVAFASRGYSIDQPLAVAPRDLPNTYTDIAAGTILANFCTDAFRSATKADLGFTANGMMRAGLTRGKSGVQTLCRGPSWREPRLGGRRPDTELTGFSGHIRCSFAAPRIHQIRSWWRAIQSNQSCTTENNAARTRSPVREGQSPARTGRLNERANHEENTRRQEAGSLQGPNTAGGGTQGQGQRPSQKSAQQRALSFSGGAPG